MKKRLKSVSVLSVAQIAGLIYFALGCILAVVLLVSGVLGLLLNTAKRGESIGLIGLGLVAPFFYGGAGFVFGAIGAAFYNIAAQKTGGIEFTVEDIDKPS